MATENNFEHSQGYEKKPKAPAFFEGREAHTSESESFFARIQKDIDEADSLKQLEERSNTLARVENFGAKLGLTKEEVAEVLEEGGFSARLNTFRDQVIDSCDEFIGRVQKAGATALTAFVFGISAPASSFAAEQNIPSARVEQAVLPSHEEATKDLHRSVMTDKNERVMISVRGKDGTFHLVSLTEGHETSASWPEESVDLLEQGEEVEFVHTHPLEGSSFAGVMNSEEIARAREGREFPRCLPPSGDADLVSAIFLDASAQKNGGVAHYKIVEPSGEWSYGILDRNAPFIKLMNRISSVIDTDIIEASPEEKEYIKDLTKKFPDQRSLVPELRTRIAAGDTMAKIISEKVGVEKKISKILSSMSKEEQDSMDAFIQYLEGNYFHTSGATNEQMNKEDVEFYERAAKKLGFSLKYTSNKK